VLYSLKGRLSVGSQHSLHCLRSYLEDPAHHVGLPHLLLKLIELLLVLPDRILQVGSAVLLYDETPAAEGKTSISYHHSPQLDVRKFYQVLSFVLEDFDPGWSGHLGVGMVEAHIDLHIDEPACFEFVSLHVVS
jgi:hypothetical protein